MSATDAAFAGSIPQIYHQRLGPVLFEPFAADLAGRVFGQGGQILERSRRMWSERRADPLRAPRPAPIKAPARGEAPRFQAPARRSTTVLQRRLDSYELVGK